MNIQLMSIVAGTRVCNARCPFCISKMTPVNGIGFKEPEINIRNFRKACKFASINEVHTVMITSKGEPLLYPNQITKYLEELEKFEFPIIELQTNGILIDLEEEKYLFYLKKWYELGLTTIAISIVHYNREKNRQIYLPHKKEYVNLPKIILILKEIGYSVRLACTLAKNYIDSPQEVENLIKFAKENKVEQLKVTPVDKPEKSGDEDIFNWAKEHYLEKDEIKEIDKYLRSSGTALLKFNLGDTVYDVKGQNVCLKRCLTIDKNLEKINAIMFFPDGHLRYDWQYAGAILF